MEERIFLCIIGRLFLVYGGILLLLEMTGCITSMAPIFIISVLYVSVFFLIAGIMCHYLYGKEIALSEFTLKLFLVALLVAFVGLMCVGYYGREILQAKSVDHNCAMYWACGLIAVGILISGAGWLKKLVKSVDSKGKSCPG